MLDLELTVETDHKPLVPLLGTAEFHKMPPHNQRFRLRLMRYNSKVVHVAGKNQITADALSRAPVGDPDSANVDLTDNTTASVKQTTEILPVLPASCRRSEKNRKQTTFSTKSENTTCKAGQSICSRTAFSSNTG